MAFTFSNIRNLGRFAFTQSLTFQIMLDLVPLPSVKPCCKPACDTL